MDLSRITTRGFFTPTPAGAESTSSEADYAYDCGMMNLTSREKNSFDLAVLHLKKAADMGHEDARVVLRSLCDGHVRKRLHTGTEPATWSRFKDLLFAAYAPWERVDYLKAQPPVSGDVPLLTIIPPDILEAIYQSNVEATNKGSSDTQAKAWLVCAELQWTGRGVQQSYFEAYKSLCLAQQLDHKAVTDGLINHIIERVEMELGILLNPASDKASKETILQENDFGSGLQFLKIAADSGNQRARQALASICIELLSTLPIPLQILTTVPPSLRKEIYESNLALVKENNPKAIYAQAQMQLDGFGVNKSSLNALVTLCTIRITKPMPGNLAEEVATLINEITSAITPWVLPLLNPSSKDLPKADIPVYEQQALIMRIQARKDKLSINEQLTITRADLIQELRFLQRFIFPNEPCPTPDTLENSKPIMLALDNQTLPKLFMESLVKYGDRLRIVTTECTLPSELWVNIIFSGLWVQGPSVLVQLNKAFSDNSENFWRPLLREGIHQYRYLSISLLCLEDQRNVKSQFFPGSLPCSSSDFFAKTEAEQTEILKQFYRSIHIRCDRGLVHIIWLIENSWFQKKVNDGLLDLNDALKFPRLWVAYLQSSRVQTLLDQHPRFLSKLDNASEAFVDCLNLDPNGQWKAHDFCPEGEIISFLFGGAVKDETLLNMTRQGLTTLKRAGVCQFLSAHPEFIDFYLTTSHHDEIYRPLRHQQIQQALVTGELTVEHLTDPNVLNILCDEDNLDLVRSHPAFLGQVLILRSALNDSLMLRLRSATVQRMLATGMLALEQVNPIGIDGYWGMTMSASIIIDAVLRDAIPKDIEIKFYRINFGALPNDTLDLPENIKLDSCTLGSGVLTIGAKQWKGPCTITS